MTESVFMPAIPADERNYIAAVLWVHGRSLGDIAATVGWTRMQAKAFTNRLLPNKARAHLEDAERAAILEHFASNRRDRGRLRDEHFKPIPLPGRPAEMSRSDVILAIEESWGECVLAARDITDPHERTISIKNCHEAHRDKLREAGVEEDKIPDPSSMRGRKEVREIERRAAQRRKKRQEEAAQRELGGAERELWKDSTGAIRNLSRPLEYLFRRRLLADGKATSSDRHSEEMRRYEAGERLQRYIDGARIATMGAMDMEKATMGSSGSGAMSLSGYRLYCAQSIGAIRSMMPRRDYLTLEAIIDQDIFVWRDAPKDSPRRAAEIDRIRRLLDVVAVYENLMAAASYTDRWGEGLVLPDDIPTRHAAAAAAELVADLVGGAR